MKTMKWERKPLGSLADRCLGKMLDQNKNRGEPFPYLANVNVRWGEFELSDLRTMRFESKEMDRYGLKFGNIVMCEGGEPGRCAIWKGQLPGMMIQKAIHRIRPNELLDYRFLFYSFLHLGHSKVFDQYFTGATIKYLTGEKLAKVEVDIPPLPTQKRIASILSAYDELIENSQRRIKILEAMARSLYREWFVHFRYPGHENHPRVASALGEIPLGWAAKALDDVCTRITDGSHLSPQSVEDGYPMASVKDMHDWGINVKGCRRISSVDYENLVQNDCKPLTNVLLIAKDGSYLKHTFVVSEEQDLVILSSIAMLRPNDSIRPNYLCLALRNPVTKARMKGIVSGVAIPRIVLKDFRKFEILVPPDDVQDAWTKIVDPMLAKCRKLVGQTENLRRTRDLLLPRLLSGQIDIEAAQSILARIRDCTERVDPAGIA